MTRGRARVATAAWMVFLLGALWGLRNVPIDQPTGVSDPIIGAFAAIRVLAEVVGVYLLAATAVGLLARALRLRWLVAAADLVTVKGVRQLAAAAAGISLALGPTAALAGPAGNASPEPPVMTVLEAGPPDAGPPPPVPAAPPPVLRRLPAEPAPASTATQPPPADADAPAPAPSPASSSPLTTTATIRAGGNLWRLADSTLARSWGRPPSNAEIVPYWRALIDRNRTILTSPDNPDLVYSGQTFELPTPPPRP